MNVKISDHALERYRERVGPLPDGAGAARDTILGLLATAKAKHVRKIGAGKKTVMVPIKDCMFVFEGKSMVTVLERKPA